MDGKWMDGKWIWMGSDGWKWMDGSGWMESGWMEVDGWKWMEVKWMDVDEVGRGAGESTLRPRARNFGSSCTADLDPPQPLRQKVRLANHAAWSVVDPR
jgi:hypothetical protein